MADPETTITITAVDDTAPATKSAIKNVLQLTEAQKKNYKVMDDGSLISIRAVRERAKVSKYSYDELMANIEKAHRGETAATDASEKNSKRRRKGQKDEEQAINATAAALGRMATRYVSAAAAFEFTRRGFMGYAQMDTRLRLVQNNTGATREQIDKLHDSMKAVSAQTGDTTDVLLAGFEQLREAAGLTIDQTKKIFPDMAIIAKGAGADVSQFGRALGDILRNLNIPAEQAGKVMEAMSYGASALNLNIGEIGPSLSKLTEMMSAWGYTGVDGANRMIAILGTVKKATGDAGMAASVMTHIYANLGDEKMGDALGFAPGEFHKALKQIQRDGGDVLGAAVGWMMEASDQRAVMEAIGIRDTTVMNRLRKEYYGVGQTIEGVNKATGALGRGMNVLDGPEAKVNRLINAFDSLAQSLGVLVDAFGATTIMNNLADDILTVVKGLERAVSLLEWIKTGKRPDWTYGWDYKLTEKRKPGFGIGPELEKPYEEHMAEQGLNVDGTPILGPTGIPVGPRPPKTPSLSDVTGKPRVLTPDEIGKRLPDVNAPAPILTPDEIERHLQRLPDVNTPEGRRALDALQKHSAVLNDNVKQLVAFSEALPDTEDMRILKAAVGVPGYEPTYGGSSDARFLKASYTPSGEGFLGYGGGGGGGGGGGRDSVAGPGVGGGTGYGGGGYVGGGGVSAGGGVPNIEGMTEEERNQLGLILQHESGNANVMNFEGKRQGISPTQPKGYTAQGYYQILNSNWASIAPGLGIKAPNAMAATKEEQTKVALALLRNQKGIRNWSDYNPKLRAALGRGDKTTLGDDVPSIGGRGIDMLRADMDAEGMHTTSGYRAPDDPLTEANPRSKHSQGLAFDTRARTPEQVDAAMAKQRQKFDSMGLVYGRDYTFLDEVRNPSAHATGPHLHTQLTPEGMRRYQEHKSAQKGAPAPTASATPPAATAPAPAPQLPEGQQNVQLNLQVNDNQVQFARTSMRRAADREVREARWNSYADIGAA